MTLQSDLIQMLSGDSILSAILTGGWWDAETLPRQGISMSNAPKSSDGVSIAPFGVIRQRGMTDEGIRDLNAERGSVEFYIYADKGYALIEGAITRLKVLLHRGVLTSSDVSLAHFQFTFVSGELMADEIGNVPFKFCRFSLIIRRK